MLQYVLLDTTTNPVTQTAEVAVNRASISETCVSCAVAIGRLNRTVPNRIRIKKDDVNVIRAENWAGKPDLRRLVCRMVRVLC